MNPPIVTLFGASASALNTVALSFFTSIFLVSNDSLTVRFSAVAVTVLRFSASISSEYIADALIAKTFLPLALVVEYMPGSAEFASIPRAVQILAKSSTGLFPSLPKMPIICAVDQSPVLPSV